MTDTNELDGIPGMPSADEVRAELLRTGSPAYWRPNGAPDGTATDLDALPPAHREKLIAARLALGPGPNGTPWQKAQFEHHQRVIALEKEQAQLMERVTAIKGYDPNTGENISLAPADALRGMVDRLSAINDELGRLNGPIGAASLERALDEAVKARREHHRREYMLAEAKRRASASEMEAEIERLAAGFRKTLPTA